jgi:hypothetical protein
MSETHGKPHRPGRIYRIVESKGARDGSRRGTQP